MLGVTVESRKEILEKLRDLKNDVDTKIIKKRGEIVVIIADSLSFTEVEVIGRNTSNSNVRIKVTDILDVYSA